MLYEIQAKYYWPGMKNDINDYLDKCEHCATHKIRTGIPKPPTKPITTERILERIQIDFTSFEYADPLTGDRHVLTVIDCFSKFGWAKAFPTQDAEPIARYILEIFLNELKYPEILQSDNGKSFLAQVMKDLLALFGTKQKNSRPYHPATNGQIEKFNGTHGLTKCRSWSRSTMTHITARLDESLLKSFDPGMSAANLWVRFP
jgi:transposase InsO family protein